MTNPDTGLTSLGPIACVTVTAPDLDAVEHAYTKYLDQQVIARGVISADQAALWGTPGMADRRYLLLSPAAGTESIFRFIEAPTDTDYVPFSTYGWNAAEIMVQDVDAMAVRLADSPFEIVGQPQNLSFSDDIRAMQILGPGKELLYLTEFKKQLPAFDTPVARCSVDRVFIVILGGPSMDGLQNFYGSEFGVPGAPAVESRVKGMSAAFGNSPEHKYLIAALPLAGKTLIEADEMPAEAKRRPQQAGLLPAGISIISFIGHNVDTASAAEAISSEAPYGAHAQVTCKTGPAGEIIEVIHA